MALTFLSARLGLVSHAFLGGADSRGLDRKWIRGTALRAAMRFWYRAAAAPHLGYDYRELAAKEADLFGTVHPKAQTTFRLQVDDFKNFAEVERLPYCPHAEPNERHGGAAGYRSRGKGSAPATKPGANLRIKLQRRTPSFPNPTQTKALAASLWLAANLGAVGKRARRGSGSLELIEWLTGDPSQLPAGPNQTLDDLRQSLSSGINVALSLVCAHCGQGRRPGRSQAFAIAGPDDAFISDTAFPDSVQARIKIGSTTSRLLAEYHDTYGRAMGRVNRPGRLASPLFVRLSAVGEESDLQYYPVMTWSTSRARGREELRVVEDFLAQFQASPLGRSTP